MSSEKHELNVLRDVSPNRHQGSSRSIHPYFGKVDPSLVLKSLELLSSCSDKVLDPFCGSGTVLHDSLLAGRNALGWDSSPLAVLISTCKVLGITHNEKQEMLDFVSRELPNDETILAAEFTGTRDKIPSMPRVSSIADWFTQNALNELSFIRGKLDMLSSQISLEAFTLLSIAFSKIITSASNQQGESTYRRVEKKDHSGRVFSLYRSAVHSIIKSTESFNTEARSSNLDIKANRLKRTVNGYEVRYDSLCCSICLIDSRTQLDNDCKSINANLVITSPPYLMSWDYGLYHKLRFYWMGFDLNQYEDTEIGRHLRRKGDDVPRYKADMKSVFQRLHKATSHDARVAMVNATSVVYGELVDTNQLIIEVAKEAGWSCIWCNDTIDIPGPHHGMYSSLSSRKALAPGAAGKKEHVIVFKRVNSVV